jgi:hypothetical protein
MSRLIDADKALQAVDKRIEELYKMEVFRKKADNIDVLGVKKWINDIPTINAIPIEAVKKAREEISDYNIKEHYFGSDSFLIGIANGMDKAVEILDKLIAESEG